MHSSQLTYLKLLDEAHFIKKEIDINDVLFFLQYLKKLEFGLNFFSGYTFFVIDYIRRRHILMKGPVKQILGFHPRDFLEGGLDFGVSIFHKDDLSIFSEKCMTNVMELFRQTPHEEHSQHVFEMNYRWAKKDGGFINVLQKGSYITDESSGLPVYSFGVASDISNYKKDHNIIQSIYKRDNDIASNTYRNIATYYYYPEPDEALLTARETEILSWMADGLSSKMIADKFKLSHNTIMNHRKNILRKTNTKNVAELIRYAITN